MDIAYHITADEGWGVPDSYAAAFAMLADHAVIDRDLAQHLSAIARVRNRIARGYASVDHARMWEDLPGGLDKLEQLAHQVAAWLPDDPGT